jgi:hypothetical protein
MRGLCDLDGLPASLAALQPQLAFALDDLAACDEDALHARRLGAEALLPLLHLQQVRRAASTAALLTGWLRLFRRLIEEPGRPASRRLLEQLMSYVAAVSADDPEDLRLAYSSIHPITEAIHMTTAEKLLQKGRVEGRQEGRHEGRLEGDREARCDVLLSLLRQRFGEVPADAARRVAAADAASLDRWLQRVLTAPSLAATLLP